MFAIDGHNVTKSRAPHTFINMVATNHALVEKHGVIPYVRSLTFRTSTRVRFRNPWAESKLRSLLSAHHLIGAYFLAAEGDKRMRLLTRLYGSSLSDGLQSNVLHGWTIIPSVVLIVK